MIGAIKGDTMSLDSSSYDGSMQERWKQPVVTPHTLNFLNPSLQNGEVTPLILTIGTTVGTPNPKP